MFVLLGWFVRWVVSGRTTFLLVVASRICSKWHVVFLCSSHPTFSPCVSLVSNWCTYAVVPTQPELGRNPVLFYQINDSSRLRWTHVSVDEILLTSYGNWLVNFRGMPLKVNMATTCLRHTKYEMRSFIDGRGFFWPPPHPPNYFHSVRQ